MPELTDLVPWEDVSWDNMREEWYSGGRILTKRPYFYRVIPGKGKNLLIISAVPSEKQPGDYHAVDYLRLTKEGFDKLMQLGQEVWG